MLCVILWNLGGICFIKVDENCLMKIGKEFKIF